MRMDFSNPGKVVFTMIDFIHNMLEELPPDMDGVATTPAANHLFRVNSAAPKLDGKTADLFHTLVAKLLYLCKRARPDIQTAVAFLTTRVACPDRDDYGKLRRVMQYLRSTLSLPLTLEGNHNGCIKWWVDASFAVHPDMRSHTGAVLSLGKGVPYAMSTRQRINTTSSTEGELVGVHDAMPSILWTRHFLQEQGVHVHDNVVYQDNQSAILLERNGRASSSKRTRHINIRYFFVSDRIQNNELRVEYCPTDKMLADIFTKPLQGSLFRRLRDQLLNIETDPSHLQLTGSQECVENDLSDTMVADDGTDEIDPAATHEDGWTTVHHTKRKRPQIRKQFKANSVSAL